MKLLGLLLVVCCGAGIGVMQAMRLRQTHRNLEQLCRMLRELSVQMAFRSLTVQELLEQLCREPAYAAFQFPVLVLSGLEQGMPLADAWESGIRQDKAIPETGKNLLLPLGEELGASDLDGQTATLSQSRRQLEPYAAEAGELCRRKSGGISCGDAAAERHSGCPGSGGNEYCGGQQHRDRTSHSGLWRCRSGRTAADRLSGKRGEYPCGNGFLNRCGKS